jgi:phosphatidylserine decarboxylase
MRIPITKYGWPQVVFYPAALVAAMVAFPLATASFLKPWAIVLAEAVLAVILVSLLGFFRDPYRSCPSDKNLLLSPADGLVTSIEEVQEDSFIGGKALRISIFLSILNAHINRAPCNAEVETITYRRGRHANALRAESGRVNESNDLGLVRADCPTDRLLVRQISGAVARRIVCRAARGRRLTCGEKFGMIKFGSRTELYLPVRANARCLVRAGDKVKAGLTPLVRYEQCHD